MKKVIKLLDDHPNVKEVVRAWFTERLVKTLDDSMPKEFQEFVKAQQVTNEKLAVMVKEGPRGLFDVFDDNEIYINIVYQDEVGFIWDMGHPHGGNPSIPYNNRRDAEHKAIFKAFEILEKKLKPKKDEEKEEES
tara:strand:- start:188 stop:592 length:405 start_codon:yes stop_codon:yes gene_type:complete